MYRLYLLLAVLLLTACAAPSTLLVNSQGKVQRCAAYGAGWLGTPTAFKIHESCVDDMKKLGYMELPDVLLGVIAKDWSASPLVVSQVNDRTPAQAVGLQPGDILKEMDGQPIATFNDLMTLLMTKQPGDVLKVKLDRDGHELEVSPILAKRS